MKYNKNRKIYRLPFFILIILSVIFSSFWLTSCGSKVKPSVIIEAGSPFPNVTEFFMSPKTTGKITTDTAVIDTKKVGETVIELEIGKRVFTSVLIVQDTVPPSGKPAEQYILSGNELFPEDLVTDIQDATQIACAFASAPDFNSPGWQDITVILTDEGNNSTNIDARFYVYNVTPELTLEAGDKPVLTAQDFIDNYIEPPAESESLSLINADDIDFLLPGSYPVTLTLGDYKAESAVKIQDTTPPSGKPAELYIFTGNEILPESLVTDIKDVTPVTCAFASTPDFNVPGWQDITVILTDGEDNRTNIDARFYVFGVIPELTFEAGEAVNISAANFISNYDGIEKHDLTLTETKKIDFLVPGEYPVVLKSGNYEASSVVKIADATPPKADIKNLTALKNKTVTADKFAYNITDVSPVTVRYKTTPDFSAVGKHDVYIILEDKYNNISEYKAVLTVVADTTPPVISGNFNKWAVIGGSVSYRTGITVKDDYDEKVQLVVDSSAVNLNKAGTYTVIYSATDESGNKAEVKGSVTVSVIDMNLVNDMADDILSKIITADMSGLSKAKAIYNWVVGKMKYSAATTSLNLAQRAYDCFTRGRGDCYTYAAASQVLLTRAGIDNVMINRLPELNHAHYWNLVNVGGGWYHFDACPTPGNAVTNSQRFMFTESQAQQYTQAIRTSYLYYAYDKTKFPEVVG